MKLLRPLPRALSRPLAWTILGAWAVQMGVLVHRSYLQAASVSLAADLARYGTAAHWKGIYYRGEKIGFSVGQTLPTEDGFELQEDGRLQMTLMGASSEARISTKARVDRQFVLRSFSFSLDPGTGPIEVSGRLDGKRLQLDINTPSGRRSETRELPEAPALSLNLSRHLAAQGLEAGRHYELSVLDPATLRNAPMLVDVEGRELVRAAGRPVPAFKVRTSFGGIESTSWITDTGEVVREESPLGLMVVKETRERALAQSMPRDVQADLLEAAAIVPETKQRIDDPRLVTRLTLQVEGAPLSGPDLQGAGQSVEGSLITLVDAEELRAGPADPQAASYLAPEPFIESDAPEIVAEARAAVAGEAGARARAERLVRHVNALLEKKPTVSLPSALEVLRTRIGDCNEHTALYVALARAAGLPARVAVGLVYLRGAFYYHAWPEVYLDEGRGRGLWLPVDPTLNQFPADATHVRLARGGLDKQTAILAFIGRARMKMVDLRLREGTVPTLVGAPEPRPGTALALPRREPPRRACWSAPRR
ncbi:MAG TPA: transglutaminase domain-containing protein [Vicinamibacteria bacterium]|nr:transglutaminase domain-containing protein [Vicinamibacteria bacterium]